MQQMQLLWFVWAYDMFVFDYIKFECNKTYDYMTIVLTHHGVCPTIQN